MYERYYKTTDLIVAVFTVLFPIGMFALIGATSPEVPRRAQDAAPAHAVHYIGTQARITVDQQRQMCQIELATGANVAALSHVVAADILKEVKSHQKTAIPCQPLKAVKSIAPSITW